MKLRVVAATAALVGLAVAVPTTVSLQAGGETTTTTTTEADSPPNAQPEVNGENGDKVFVCKYVGTPGVDEELQTGQNPISVSVNAIPLDDVEVGSEFADEQGRSLVIAFDTGQDEPSAEDCPPPDDGTTTTTTTGVERSTTTVLSTSSTTSTTTLITTTTSLTTTTSSLPTTTISSSTSTTPTTTTTPSTTSSSSVPPPAPAPFSIGGATTVCVRDAPFVNITFGPRTDLNDSTILIEFLLQVEEEAQGFRQQVSSGEVIETAEVVYQAGETVQLIYPGASVDAQGNAIDWPGWILNEDGFWVTDPTDAAFRDGLNIVATALLTDETATASIEYPAATEVCAGPDGPFPPGSTTTTVPGSTTTTVPGQTTTTTVPGQAPPPAPPAALPPTR